MDRRCFGSAFTSCAAERPLGNTQCVRFVEKRADKLRSRSRGAKARAELAELMGRKVHLFLHVKVKENWDEDRGVYRDMGLDWVD